MCAPELLVYGLEILANLTSGIVGHSLLVKIDTITGVFWVVVGGGWSCSKFTIVIRPYLL